jgi:hypothetical protein
MKKPNEIAKALVEKLLNDTYYPNLGQTVPAESAVNMIAEVIKIERDLNAVPKAPKVEQGYGYIRSYLEDKLKSQEAWLRSNGDKLLTDHIVEHEAHIRHLKLLINDLEYLEYCAEIVHGMRESKDSIKKLLGVLSE